MKAILFLCRTWSNYGTVKENGFKWGFSMNITMLKTIYPSLTLGKFPDEQQNMEYIWFTADNGMQIGIKKGEISKKEELLIHSLLQKEVKLPNLTEQEKIWSKILFEQVGYNIQAKKYRFIFFQTDGPVKEPELFNEVIKALTPSPILWFNEREGTIIEEIKSSSQQPAKFHELVELLMSDLYVQVSFFISEWLENISDAYHYFHWYKQIAEKSFSYANNKKVVFLKDILPTYLASLLDYSSKTMLANALLKKALDDPELLRTVRVFLESNLNVTETAKKMYLHRNSLQYRIEKFIEWTGIDIKTFEGALVIQLALASLDR
jgi:sugar diacid utilization regulator